jgi:hypothetical protein
MTLLIRQLALRRWKHPSDGKWRLQWEPTVLVFATWPIYTLSWFMSIFRVSLRFQPTPKIATGSLHPAWVLPQIITTILLLTGLAFTLITTKTFSAVVFAFALGQIAAQLCLVRDWLHPVVRTSLPPSISSPSAHSFPETLPNTPYPGKDGLHG